ncbi:hypothetical protein INT46_011109 [Mucor plumbeus]|uniref:triacylglycerol lipase n=1 Tax=Mucor plumbeus TaxID=97098 RepID=A0A8H7V3G6_9FUNG|nr:hypothetical protein INT46_011109 [Mucor plumbeus]
MIIRKLLVATLFITSSICKPQAYLGPLPLSEMSLKTIYHHFPNYGPTPNRFQVMQVDTPTQPYYVQSEIGTAYRPNSKFLEQVFAMRRSNKLLRTNQKSAELIPSPYLLPDVTDQESVLSLAEMSFNAYTELGKDGQWYDLGSKWRINSTFGWESDGMRGHVFGNTDNSHLIISFKGTSAGLFNGEPSGEKDKLNDNLLFSCCCGKVNRGWTAVCDCNDSKNQYQCDQQCLDKTISKAELYYDYAAHMYLDVADKYPGATIWLTGHSLGGAVAALLGQTFGVPAVSFESPGDRLASERLHMPRAPGAKNLPIWHFGHTADPIFIGVCTGPTSGCFYTGFAMEARCHTGKVCVWDTVKDNGWRVNVATHRIATVIEDILKKPDKFPLPKCKVQEDCQDCGLWTFKDGRDILTAANTAACM